MKKITALAFALILVLSVFAGCTTGNGGVKTGLAVITSVSKSTSAEDSKAGLAQIDSTIVAVTVDKGGKILACVIDGAQTKVNFNNQGVVTSDLTAEVKTKNELGSAYNMKSNSGIGKEWNEQAKALADYVVGKTVSQVKAIAVSDAGVPTNNDLKSSVTISISGFVNAIEQAVANAKELGASKDDTLGLGTVTSVANSKDVTEAKPGVAQAYSTYAVVTKDSSGKITSCIINASQGDVSFDDTGKITSDTTAAVKTKNEIGAAYGMKSKSQIGKEWDEQAAAFADYVKGKTTAEVKAIAVSEEGRPSGSDLTSSVTITVGDFIKAIEKAAK
ncbi:MAG: hypothetical protein PHY15_09250 [Eubacteriales bacterium]|nr:hypothetical protein [Eubacteriales bacterium]MDD4475875.1 hypothetical protein [Eubacteriales bacterium]